MIIAATGGLPGWLTSGKVRRLRHSSPGTVSLAVAENTDDARLKGGRNYHNAEFLVTTGALSCSAQGVQTQTDRVTLPFLQDCTSTHIHLMFDCSGCRHLWSRTLCLSSYGRSAGVSGCRQLATGHTERSPMCPGPVACCPVRLALVFRADARRGS